MLVQNRWLPMTALVLSLASSTSGQVSAPSSAQATAFMGTWVFTMTEPVALKGSEQTVRVWDNKGVLAASVQNGRFPPVDVTGIFKDGEMLVLTVGHHAKPPMLENGAPIWAVISLTQDAEVMKTAQMLERSQTIKRGTGKRQPD